MTTLEFKDKTSAKCKVLGSIEVNHLRYAVFLAENKDLYIYRYMQKKKKCRLFPVTDKNEFRQVCTKLNTMIKPKSGGTE